MQRPIDDPQHGKKVHKPICAVIIGWTTLGFITMKRSLPC